MRTAIVTMTGALASFGVALLVTHLGDQDIGPIVLAVVIALTLGRHPRHTDTPGRLLLLVGATVLAAVVGRLMESVPIAGDAAFVLVVAGAIWLRRFGRTATSIGAVLTIPMIGCLVVPGMPHTPLGLAVTGLVAVLTVICVMTIRFVAERLGFTPEPEPPVAPSSPAAGRIPVSTRMALQMALALVAAFAVGRLAFGSHWTWVVLTAFIVASGSRSRGDVLHRGVLRMLGGAGGVVVAAVVTPAVAAGPVVAVGMIFAVLWLATWLRQRSYAFWAAGVTAVIAVLSDLRGEEPFGVLAVRLLAIAAGGTLAVASAWFVLPIRTVAVLRRRVSETLAALSALVTAAPQHHGQRLAAFGAAQVRLREIAAPVRAHRAVTRRRRGPHPADTLDALLACAAPDAALDRKARRALDADVTALRRGLREPDGHLAPAFAELPARLAGLALDPGKPQNSPDETGDSRSETGDSRGLGA